MESIGVGPWIAIVVAVGAVGVLVGYWLGTRLGGHNTEPMRELTREHKAYKDEVREHFQQVSATMTRMVEDYREMYQHVAKGAEKLADMHHETVIEPPPKPEAITQDARASSDESPRSADPAKPAAKAPDSAAASSKSDEPRTTGEASRAQQTDTAAEAQATAPTPDSTRHAAGSQATSAKQRPQDAAIRAAAEDAATRR